MPGFDGTGPLGQGVMTGRGVGYCNPVRNAYGPGRGIGFGRGCRGISPRIAWGVGQTGVKTETKKAYLQAQADLLREELANIEELLNKDN